MHDNSEVQPEVRGLGSLWDWTCGVFRSPVLWVPLILFLAAGVASSVYVMPDWHPVGQLVGGLLFGGFCYLFPYVNRVLDEDWVPPV